MFSNPQSNQPRNIEFSLRFRYQPVLRRLGHVVKFPRAARHYKRLFGNQNKKRKPNWIFRSPPPFTIWPNWALVISVVVFHASSCG